MLAFCDDQNRSARLGDDGPSTASRVPSIQVAVAQDSCYTNLVANLTIPVDDGLLKRARIRALERGTSVSAVLNEALRAFVGEGESQARATNALLALAQRNPREGGKERTPRRWTRDELHER
jgi:plasmid stability protein